MASSSTQAALLPEPKRTETAVKPSPVRRPANKPFTIKISSQIPT